MKKLLTILLFLTIHLTGFNQQIVIPNVWINEIHYDNVGADVNEGFEIAGPVGTDLSCYRILLYNGANGQLYRTEVLSGILTDQACGFGFKWFPLPVDGFQNGAPDGIVLQYAPQTNNCGVAHADTILQLLSYEGSFTATNGPAAGLLLADIGVAETGSTPVGHSLQLGGVGTAYAQFTWQNALANTYDAVNNNQYFCGAPQATYRFTTASTTVNENAGTVIAGYVKAFNVFLQPQSVDVVIKSGTGTAADINNYTSQTLTFTPFGIDSLPLTVTVTDDAVFETTETIEFVLRNPTNNGIILADSLFTLSILDDDFQDPVVQFVAASSQVAESADSIQIAVSITNPNGNPTSVQVSVTGGTAQNFIDFTYTPATLTFPANSSSTQLVTVYIVNDAFVEGNETVAFTLSNPDNNATSGVNTTHTLTITDDDALQISVYPTAQSEFENVGTVFIPILLNNPSVNATSISIRHRAQSGNAVLGRDFIFTDTTLTWPAGTSGTVQVPVTIIDDNYFEANETADFVIFNATNGGVITDSVFTLTILNNDQKGSACSDLFISEYVEGSSNNKALEVYNPTNTTVNLNNYLIYKSMNGGQSQAVFGMRGLLAPGQTYVMASGQSDSLLRIKADTLSGFFNYNGDDALALLRGTDTIDVIGVIGVDPGDSWPVGSGSTIDRTLVRNYYTYIGTTDWNIGSETWDVYPVNTFDSLRVHHTAPCGSILPIPNATLRFVQANATIAEANVQVAVIVEIDNQSGQNADFVVARDDNASTATPGLDFTFTNQARSIGAGITRDTVYITVIDDALIEQTETAVLRFINLSPNVDLLADSVFTLQITDSDQLIVSFLGAGFSYPESSGTVPVRITLSTPVADTTKVTVTLAPGSATKNVDFFFNDTVVVFPPFSADTQAIWVSIVDDNLVESNEQINFNLSNPTNGAVLGFSTYTLTIIDDDAVSVETMDVQSVKVYPNPANSQLVIDHAENITSVLVYDVLGKLLINNEAIAQNRYTLDVNSLHQGTYILQIVSGERTITKRFVKQ